MPDYPVLPNRWRLWSEMLRAVDRAGKSGLVAIAAGHDPWPRAQVGRNRPVGHVIGADYLFFDDKAHVDMLHERGAAPRGRRLHPAHDERGRRQRDQGPPLRAHLPHLADVPARLGGESGLRATAPFLADLLVEDLAEDGARLRKRVPELLDELVAEGTHRAVDDEYRLLTQEDAEWEKDYRSRARGYPR